MSRDVYTQAMEYLITFEMNYEFWLKHNIHWIEDITFTCFVIILILVIAASLYQLFIVPGKGPLWLYTPVKFDQPKIEKIRFKREWRDR